MYTRPQAIACGFFVCSEKGQKRGIRCKLLYFYGKNYM
nr:MAG TPA: hypothetical protein [Caudoviricetes sp.]